MIRDVVMFGLTAILSVLLSSRKEAALRKALEEGTTRDANELVFTTSEHNEPTATGHARAKMRLENLWHRATYIIVRHVPQEGDINGDNNDEPHFFVQRRTMHKDYCPGKLDPAPGGVVGFGESYEENAKRELEEEMGIDVDGTNASIARLFTFPYQDDRVRCWGGLFEVVFRGSVEDLVLQEEEVDEVLSFSLTQLQDSIESNPLEWMPDALHALKLYLQYQKDRKMKRRLLGRGYSSGDTDRYELRPKPKVVFFDCDDCLYFDNWVVANLLTNKIDEWCVNFGLKEGEAYKLYKKYGTCLRGLLAEGYIDHDAVDGFLEDVHAIPIATHLKEDPKLRELLLQMDPSIPRYIFTASVRHHAERCLRALGIDDLFVDIIDVKACNFETKHSKQAFEAAMRIANVQDAEACVFLDDSIKNIEAARAIGWRSILVGRVGRDCGSEIWSEHAENEIDRIHEFPTVLPELFAY